jgi:hypothetical protein
LALVAALLVATVAFLAEKRTLALAAAIAMTISLASGLMMDVVARRWRQNAARAERLNRQLIGIVDAD